MENYNNVNEKKQTIVRRKIEISNINKKSSLYVTFSKRRRGLFNRAGECCVLSGAEMAIITISPAGKPYTFGHPSAEAIVDRYLTGNTSGESSSSNPVEEYCSTSHELYDKSAAKLETETSKREDTKAKADGDHEGFWLDEQSIEGLDLEELIQYVESMKNMSEIVAAKINEMEKDQASVSPSNFLALDSDPQLFDASAASNEAS